VLGEMVQTAAGKWITQPPSRCLKGHSTSVSASSTAPSHALFGSEQRNHLDSGVISYIDSRRRGLKYAVQRLDQ
jgi:hypothetical protein